MKRWHREVHIARRNHREHLRGYGWPKRQVHCTSELQKGRFRKKDAHDCGKARCLLCHFHKVFDLPQIKDKMKEFSFREQLRDLG
ncbi:MAG TPA: hypothetical protein VKS79_02685 [Gemmataceae bacterium]|nr:hypothetical protein [Gemmataceae bacterium]